MKKVFLIVLCIAASCCFIFMLAPKNSSHYFDMFNSISNLGKTFKLTFINSLTKLFGELNSISQVDFYFTADNLLRFEFSNDFSFIGIIRYFATLFISPLYLVCCMLGFMWSLLTTAISFFTIIFGGLVSIDDIELFRSIFTIL